MWLDWVLNQGPLPTALHRPSKNVTYHMYLAMNSCITDDILMKLYVHWNVILIHIWFNFHEVLATDYVIMVNFMDFKSIQRLYVMHYYSQSDET